MDRELLIRVATEALDGMRASVRWDENSPLHMSDEWLARVVIDAIMPIIQSTQ